MSLWNDFITNNQRAVDKWTQYFHAYDRHFAYFKNRPLTFLEIGCGMGGSFKMWKRYFGPHARIVSIDITPELKALEEDQVSVRIGDQSDERFLASLLEEFGEFDIVVDDGSHFMKDVHASFRFLYPRISKSGIYSIEDMHTAYWPHCGGGLRSSASFIETAKGLIDELNADHIRDGQLPPTAFTRSTISMHFYDSMVVFEKGYRIPNKSLMTGIGAPPM